MKISDIAIINKGICGDKLTDKGIKRYDHDVLNIRGVKYIFYFPLIVLYGVNDLSYFSKMNYF